MFDLYQHQTISFIKYYQVVFESTVCHTEDIFSLNFDQDYRIQIFEF